DRVFAGTAARLDALVVPRVVESAGDRSIGTVELHLPAADLLPGGIVADHGDDVDLLAGHRLELHRVEAEGAVAVDHEDLALEPRDLRGHGEGGPGGARPAGTL